MNEHDADNIVSIILVIHKFMLENIFSFALNYLLKNYSLLN